MFELVHVQVYICTCSLCTCTCKPVFELVFNIHLNSGNNSSNSGGKQNDCFNVCLYYTLFESLTYIHIQDILHHTLVVQWVAQEEVVVVDLVSGQVNN